MTRVMSHVFLRSATGGLDSRNYGRWLSYLSANPVDNDLPRSRSKHEIISLAPLADIFADRFATTDLIP